MILTGVSSSWLESIGQLFGVLAIFFIVLLLTFLSTRWIAGYQQSQLHNRNLRVVEVLRLTNNKYIEIIEAGDIYIVVAVSRDHVEKLAELTRDQLKEVSAAPDYGKDNLGESFRDALERVKQHLPKK